MLYFLVLIFCCFTEVFSIVSYCESFFHGPKGCDGISKKECMIADSTSCWPIGNNPLGVICNGSGVFNQNYQLGCETITSVTGIQLNSAPGSCQTATFGFGSDSYFIHTCEDYSPQNIILLSNYFTFPKIFDVPTCNEPNTLDKVPLAFNSGACYTQSLNPPVSISLTCGGSVITKRSYNTTDCTGAISETITFNAGQCYSVSPSAPFSTGFTYSCGAPTKAPTNPPTNRPTGQSNPTFPPSPTLQPQPTQPSAEPQPTMPATNAPTRRRWLIREVNEDFNSHRNDIQTVWSSDSRLSGAVISAGGTSASSVTDEQTLKFTVSFTTVLNDNQKNGFCQTVQSYLDANYDLVTQVYNFGCSFQTQGSKRAETSVATISLSENPGGLSTGAIILICVGSTVGIF